jgi:hypothetical protein
MDAKRFDNIRWNVFLIVCCLLMVSHAVVGCVP